MGGIFLFAGMLTRATGSIFAVILLWAIFHIRWENGFFVSKGGWEWNRVMLAAVITIIAAVITIIAAVPKRTLLAHAVKKIPRLLQRLFYFFI